ncbi:hypothetical protein ACRASQ_14340 [Bacteroides hominis]|uniref:hypothetical protein n=1 Tax=Bacteroides hominis TaxID=2763023 RepID=UPI003D6A2344
MSIILKPYKGILFYGIEINFGISQKDVNNLLGEKAPKIEIDNIMKEVREQRSGMIFCYINKKLSDITFSMNANLYINDIEVFNTNDLLENLSKIDDPTPEAKNGYVNFYKLGISIGGFGKRKIPEKRIVTAFCKSRVEFYNFFLKV